MQLYVDLKISGAITKCEIIAETEERKNYINFLFVGKEVQVEKFGNIPMTKEEVKEFYFNYICVDTAEGLGPYNIAQLVFSKYFEMVDKSINDNKEEEEKKDEI